jgi:hypothetical protein
MEDELSKSSFLVSRGRKMNIAGTIVSHSRLLDVIGKHCITNKISRGMRSVEPYTLEGFLTLCSFWAAFVLYHPPSNFASFPATFAIAERMQGSESFWATTALMGAILKLLGLLLTAMNVADGPSFFVRCVGLVISGIFWSIMGTSSALGNPDGLFGVPGLLLGVAALWTLLRLPTMRSDDF